MYIFSKNAMSDDRGDASFLEMMAFSFMIPIPIGGRCQLGYLDYLSNLQYLGMTNQPSYGLALVFCDVSFGQENADVQSFWR